MKRDQKKIMYCCESCADNEPERCGYFDRNEIRVLPHGEWCCFGCHENVHQDDDDGIRLNIPAWPELPLPPEYSPSLWQRIRGALKAGAGHG